jgi:threonyl-tRNA synthetase
MKYMRKKFKSLENHEIRALDNRNETIGKLEMPKMQNPFMLIVGEEENGTISIRRHGQEGKEQIIR